MQTEFEVTAMKEGSALPTFLILNLPTLTLQRHLPVTSNFIFCHAGLEEPVPQAMRGHPEVHL